MTHRQGTGNGKKADSLHDHDASGMSRQMGGVESFLRAGQEEFGYDVGGASKMTLEARRRRPNLVGNGDLEGRG